VLVFADLGSAVLSAETALEMLPPERRERVRLSGAPLVEGAMAAVSLAAAGAGLEEAADWERASAPPPAAADERVVSVTNALGLHARPAAQLVRMLRPLQAEVTFENLTAGVPPVSAASLHGILALGARQGHRLRLRAAGPEAAAALRDAAAFFAAGCGETAAAPARPSGPPPTETGSGELRGIPASSGIAVGPLRKLRSAPVNATEQSAEDTAVEEARLSAALQMARLETRDLLGWATDHAGAQEAAIFDAQMLLLEDPLLVEAARRLIREQHATAAFAWQSASGNFAARIAALDDPYLRARAADAADAANRVLRLLCGPPTAPVLEAPAILAAHDLTPSQVKELDPALALGIALESGGAAGHAVILARAMGIPVVAGLGAGVAAAPEGVTVGLDGERGLAWIAPGAEQVSALETRRRDWLAGREAARTGRLRQACTRDGRAVRILANVNGVEGAAEALDAGAEGIGVLRTEFLFLNRSCAPSEEEQYDAYRAIAEAMGARPLTIRTLDAGGDKSLPYIDTGVEANPFLGWRGVRISLGRRDLLRTQFRAILRAARGHRVEVLFPMIATLAELREARAVLAEAGRELGCPPVPAGVMIEVPAAVAVADLLAREAAFFSIGTNDLTQYALAADRTNPRVAALADSFDPAVLRMVRQAASAAQAAGIPATLCGELAADPLATPLLIGMGITEFSVSAALIPTLKQAVARVNAAESEALAARALGLDSAAAVRRLAAQGAAR
jgi:phosphocarrier protein FPr